MALILLLVLYVLSQMASALMASASIAVPGSKVAVLLFPFVVLLFVYSFPPGLLVYWITTNFRTAGQQYLIRRLVRSPSAVPVTVGSPIETATATPAGAKVTKSAPPVRRRKRKRSGRRR